MNRSLLFGAAIFCGMVGLVLVVLYWGGALGHHGDGPLGLKNFKHGILFLALTVVAFVFAAATRPGVQTPTS